MNRLSIKAILYGVFATMALDLIVNIVLVSILQVGSMRGAATADEIAAVAKTVKQSDAFLFAVIILGSLSAKWTRDAHVIMRFLS